MTVMLLQRFVYLARTPFYSWLVCADMRVENIFRMFRVHIFAVGLISYFDASNV